VLDRTNGKSLLTTPFATVNWASGIDAQGRPIPNKAKEPSKDARIDDTASGQQNWMYGVGSWTRSGAVTIFSESFRYAEDWHIGWREKTFEFGPNGTRLIVGWNVIANRTDGNCGGWWKAKDGTILLTDFASVHVTSEYDRGTDWTLQIYYVNAADYQFGGG